MSLPDSSDIKYENLERFKEILRDMTGGTPTYESRTKIGQAMAEVLPVADIENIYQGAIKKLLQ